MIEQSRAVVIPHPYLQHTYVAQGGIQVRTDYCHHCQAPENMIWHLPNIRLSDVGYVRTEMVFRQPTGESEGSEDWRIEPARAGDKDCHAQVARYDPWCQHRWDYAVQIYSAGISRWQELYVCRPCHETLMTFPNVRGSWPLWTDVEEHRANLFPATVDRKDG